MRYSKQREAVYDAVCKTCCHPDASYVYAEVRKVIPNISLGTVYRNLAELCELGRICKVSLQGDVERYDGTVAPHAHFVCKCCGAVEDVDVSQVSVQYAVEGATSYQITFYGECQKCRKAN